jgi:hypothetical protein
MDRLELLRIVLWLIAAYHGVMGVGGLLSTDVAARLAREVFGMELEVTPQSGYLIRLLCIYALAFGYFAGLAALDPVRNPALLDGIVLLYTLRIALKLGSLKVYEEAFRASAQRVWTDAALLALFGLSVLLLKP